MTENNVPERVVHRILEKIQIDPETKCWVWPGGLSSGYGRIGWRENGEASWGAVHRIIWAHFNGPIPEGLDLDHLCHNPAYCNQAKKCIHRRCCNPHHLEPVNRQENLARGGTIAALHAKITHCPEGHAYDETNTRYDKIGRRYCKECVRARNRAYYHRNKERRSEYNRQWRLKNSNKNR